MVKEVKELRDEQIKTAKICTGILSGVVGLTTAIMTFIVGKSAYNWGEENAAIVCGRSARIDPDFPLQFRETKED